MDAKRLFIQAVAQATAVIDKVEPDDFQNPTPNHDWNVHDLVGHMLYELCWVPDLLAGKTIHQVGVCYEGDLIGNALQANWHAALERALAAVAQVPLKQAVHAAQGDIAAEEYLRQAGADQLIHAWDLGEGIGAPVSFDAPLAAAVHEYMTPQAHAWQAEGLFGPPVAVPESADMQTKLLAVTGRHVNWPAM